MRILSAADVRRAVTMPQAIDAVAVAFARLDAGHATVPLRTAIELPEHDAVSLFMPARMVGDTPDEAALGVKVVSVFPNNGERHNQPNIQAVVTLFDPTTGTPLVLMDGTYLTALRTGAGAGVATRYMARPDAAVLALFGAGAQAMPQIQAVCAERPITQLWLVNRTRSRADALRERVLAEGLVNDVQVATSPSAALANADVVCCATSAESPLFDDGDVQQGTHINAVGAYKPTMAEVPAATVARARVVVDQRAAAWAEAGDLVLALAAGAIDEQHIVGELGELVRGAVAGRINSVEVTFFKSVGNAIQDLAVAQCAFEQATAQGLGTEVALA